MTLDEWYAAAAADADRRDLPDLIPVLKGLHASAAALRAAAWNDDANGTAAPSASSTPDTVVPSTPPPRTSS